MDEVKERRFGWYRPKSDGKLDLQVVAQVIDKESWAEFEEHTSVVSELRAYVIDYLALKADFEALQHTDVELGNRLTDFMKNGLVGAPEGIEAQSEAQRRLTNFLGAASALRDRAATRLARRHGEDSPQFLALKKKMAECFDTSFPYRTLYALRNYAQHHENPISMVPIESNRADNGLMHVRVSLLLNPAILAASKDVRAKTRSELASRGTDPIPLLPLCADFMRAHEQILLSIFELHADRIAGMIHYAAALYRVFEIPEDVVPVVWEGTDPAGGPQTQTKAYICGIDELKRILDLADRFRGAT